MDPVPIASLARLAAVRCGRLRRARRWRVARCIRRRSASGPRAPADSVPAASQELASSAASGTVRRPRRGRAGRDSVSAAAPISTPTSTSIERPEASAIATGSAARSLVGMGRVVMAFASSWWCSWWCVVATGASLSPAPVPTRKMQATYQDRSIGGLPGPSTPRGVGRGAGRRAVVVTRSPARVPARASCRRLPRRPCLDARSRRPAVDSTMHH